MLVNHNTFMEETILSLGNPFVEPVIIFTHEAIACIKRMTEIFKPHVAIYDMIDFYQIDVIKVQGLESILERKLVSYITHTLLLNESCTITESFVISRCYELFESVKSWSYELLSLETESQGITNNYPISLIANICKLPEKYVHMIGESVKYFIDVREEYPNCLPKQLYNVIEGRISLTGSPNSPLTEIELRALHRYLGSRKNIYVHMFLNMGFELKGFFHLLFKVLEEDEIKILCNSAYIYLILLTAAQIDIRRKEKIEYFNVAFSDPLTENSIDVPVDFPTEFPIEFPVDFPTEFPTETVSGKGFTENMNMDEILTWIDNNSNNKVLISNNEETPVIQEDVDKDKTSDVVWEPEDYVIS